MRTIARWLAVVVTVGMFAVLVMGATVTNTGSARGCGGSWPLCHGRLIPQFAVSTFIEFSHRAVVGVESVLIIALAVLALVLYRHSYAMRVLVPIMVVTLFLQAGLGAWAVMAPQDPAVLALHFGVSLLAFASVLLTAAVVLTEGEAHVPPPVPYRWFVWGLTAFTYVVVYLGAYVRHINADDACKDWPLCHGQLVPALTHSVAAVLLHRAAAALLIAGVVLLVVWTRRFRGDRPDLFRAAVLALHLVVAQALVGAIIVWTDMDIFSALAHAALAGLFFATLSYLCLGVLPARQAAAQPLDLRPVTAGNR